MGRANLDGTDFLRIVSARLDNIVSITLDIIDKRVFFLDDGNSRIESVDYDGRNREIVRAELRLVLMVRATLSPSFDDEGHFNSMKSTVYQYQFHSLYVKIKFCSLMTC